ncbi:MAG: hypothetical protein M9934_05390 [Thermomicrobiales bacterium]|nr:hypothetical protein [Thermomicrobiales bacterium]
MELRDVQTNEGIGDWLRAAKAEVGVLGVTEFNEPIWVAKCGGDKLPAIVITAGSHADEVAGIYAALDLVKSLDSDHAVYVVPCRDPLGWNGFSATLQRALPGSDPVRNYDDAVEILRSGEVLYDDGSFVIARIGRLCFATEPEQKWASTAITRHKLPALLRENADLANELRNERILVPGNIEVEDGRTSYSYGGHTAYIGNGYFAQLNRFFDRDDGPIEVTALREFVDRIKPGLSLDLHEGFSSNFYLFTHAASSAETLTLAETMIDAVRQIGGTIATRDQLEPVWGPKTSAGIISQGQGIFTMGPPGSDPHASFSGYCDQFGVSLTTESGMEADVDTRVKQIQAGSTAVIDAFVAQHGEG